MKEGLIGCWFDGEAVIMMMGHHTEGGGLIARQRGFFDGLGGWRRLAVVIRCICNANNPFSPQSSSQPQARSKVALYNARTAYRRLAAPGARPPPWS